MIKPQRYVSAKAEQNKLISETKLLSISFHIRLLIQQEFVKLGHRAVDDSFVGLAIRVPRVPAHYNRCTDHPI